MRNLIHFFKICLANKETMKDRKAIKYFENGFRWLQRKLSMIFSKIEVKSTGFKWVGINEVQHPNINLLWYP